MTYYIGTVPFSNDDMRHYGRLGMKWGHHIFRNEDQIIKNGPALAKSQSTIFREGSNIANQYSHRNKPTASTRKTLDEMSDVQLRNIVNRMNLEQQYLRMSGEDTRRGAAIAKDVLQTAGSVAAITASALTSVMLIKKLL